MGAGRTVALYSALVLIASNMARGAFDPLPSGARAAVLSGALRLSRCTPLAAAANPALSPMGNNAALELSCFPGLFNLPELRQVDLGLAFPVLKGGAACLARTFGNALYRELSLSAAAALPVTDRFCAGIGLTWYHLAIRGYGSAS